MGDTPEQQATKDALAIRGKWRDGKSYSGVEIIGESLLRGGVGGGSMVTTNEGISPLEAGKHAAAPAIGSTIGAVAGSRFGIGGRLLGAGVGAAGGSLVNSAAGMPGPTGNPLLDALMIGGGALGGQGVGEATTFTGKVAASPLAARPAPGAPGLRQQFGQAGVDLNVADVSPNMAALERSVAQTPTGGMVIRDAADRRANQFMRAKDEFLDRVAPAAAGERVAVGEKASTAIERHIERTGALEDVLWASVGHQANDVPVRLDNLKAFAETALLSEKRGKNPNKSAVAFLEKIVNEPGEWAWQTADATRKQYGRDMKGIRQIAEVPDSFFKGAYGALLNDMEAAAGSSGVVGLAESYKNLRTFSEHRRAIFRDGQVAKVLDRDPEQVVSTLNAAGGPTAIKRAREGILGSPELGQAMPNPGDVEAWNYVRRHILEGVFRAATDEHYKGLSNPVVVGSRLDKALKTIGEDGLKELLNDTERAALKNLTAVAKAMRASESTGALPGTSTTPQGLGFLNLITAVPGTLGGLAGGAVGGGVGAGVGASLASTGSFILVPHFMAKLLTNPKLAAVIASPGFAGLASGTKMTASAAREGTQALARLGGILAAEAQGGE